jgi:hypothetical protein
MKFSKSILQLINNITETASGLAEKITVLFEKRKEFIKNIQTTDEYIEFELKLKELKITKTSSSVTTNALKVNDGFTLLCLTLVQLKKDNSNDITIEDWKSLFETIKPSGRQYVNEIKKQVREGFRHLARYLDRINNFEYSHGYLVLLEVPKRKNITLRNYVENLVIRENHPYKKWIDSYIEWLNFKSLKNTSNHWDSFHILLEFLTTNNHPKDVGVFLLQLAKTNKSNFIQFLEDQKTKYIDETITHIFQFTGWYNAQNLSLNDDDESNENNFGETIPTSTEMNLHQKNHSKNQPKPTESTKIKIPSKYLFLMRDILTRNDYEWGKSLPSEYFNHPNKGLIWCPCNTYMILSMLEIPLRRIQVAMLDSGEGDTVKYSQSDNQWVDNSGQFKNYWMLMGQQKENRGVISYSPDLKTKTSIYINTNKNADRAVNFGVESGYIIPWHNISLITIFSELRDWQEKYNPVSKPTKYNELNPCVCNDKMPTESVLESIPPRFYLFRNPKTSKGEKPYSPLPEIETFRFFWQLMLQLQKEWNELNPDEPIEIITKYNKTTGSPEGALFTPHGLRVAGITGLVEAGVPLEIISKILVAHSSILITIYYVKHEREYIDQTLDKAKKHLEDEQKIKFLKALTTDTFEKAKKYMYFNSEETLRNITSNQIPVLLITSNNIGVCPYGLTRCSDGGPLLRTQNKKKPLHAPVEGGSGTCILCRHFITGVAWLTEIWLYTNKCLSDLRDMACDFSNLKSRLENKNIEKYQLVKNHESPSNLVEISREISELNSLYEHKAAELDLMIKKLQASYRVLEALKQIANDKNKMDENINNTLPTTGIESDLTLDFADVGDFAAKHLLIKASRLHPHIEDAKNENQRNRILDKILCNNGLQPITLTNLSQDEINTASDAMCDLLLSKLKANQINDLSANRLKLSDLGLSEEDFTNTLKITE